MRTIWTANQGKVQIYVVWIKKMGLFSGLYLCIHAIDIYLTLTMCLALFCMWGDSSDKREQAFALMELTFLWRQADDRYLNE